MKNIDELAWIGNFYGNGLDLKVRGIEHVTNFTFLWNMFETFACETSASYERIDIAVDKMKNIDTKQVAVYNDYFTNRYIDKQGNSNALFQGLKFRPAGGDVNAKAKVLDVLTNKSTDAKDVLKALLYILYRFRNNLFHGGKNVANIVNQIENFVVANQLLMELLDQMKNDGLVQFNL